MRRKNCKGANLIMQSEIYNIISTLAEDISTKIPEAFEKKYYMKMSYSNENKIIELDKKILIETISFEVAFVHVIIFIFNRCFNIGNINYYILLERLDVDELFSWYSMSEKFVADNLNDLNVHEFTDICESINQHDTFINKNIKGCVNLQVWFYIRPPLSKILPELLNHSLHRLLSGHNPNKSLRHR